MSLSTFDKLSNHFGRSNNLNLEIEGDEQSDQWDVYLEDDMLPPPSHKIPLPPHEKGTMRITKDSGGLFYVRGRPVTEEIFMKYRQMVIDNMSTRW